MSDEVEYATQQALSNEGAQSVALTDSKPMRDLLHANGEDNAETFEWHITKLPEDQIVPAATVKRVAMALYAEVYVTRAREPTWTDEQIREHVVGGNDAFVKLARTHPRLILLLTGRECTVKKITHVLELIELRMQHEQATSLSMEEKQQQVSAYFQSHFVREAKPGEEEAAVRAGTGLRGEVVKVPVTKK